MNVVSSNNQSLNYLRFTLSGCKEITKSISLWQRLNFFAWNCQNYAKIGLGGIPKMPPKIMTNLAFCAVWQTLSQNPQPPNSDGLDSSA